MEFPGTVPPGRDERRGKVVSLALLLFLIFAAIALGRSLRLTFLLQTFGIRSLPYLYALNAVFAISVSLAFAGIVDRVRRQRALFFTSVILGTLALAGWGWVGQRYFPVVFFIGVEVATVLLLAQFWNLAAVFFSVREAKRVFPLLSAGGLIGAAAAGFALKLGVELVHTENVLLILGGILILAGVLSGRLAEPARPSPGASFPAAGGIRESFARPFRELGEGIRYTSRSRFVQFFFLAFMFSVFITYLIEYEYNRVANLAFPEADRLTAFYGLVQGITFAAAVAVNLLVLGRAFEFFGVGLAYIFYPLGLFGFSGMMAATGGFFGTVGTRMANDLFLYSVNDSAGNLFLGSVPEGVRGKIRSLVIGVGRPLALFFSGLFLIFGAEALPTGIRLAGISILAGAWLLVAIIPLRKHYLSLLGDNLSKGDQELKLHALRSLKKIRTAQGYTYIQNILTGGDRKSVPLVVSLILSTGPPRLLRRLVDLAGTDDPQLMIGAIRAALRLEDERFVPRLREFLQNPDPEVRREAARAYPAFRPPDLATVFRERLDEERDFTVRAVLREGMIPEGLSGEEWKEEARRMLGSEVGARLAALDLIGKAGLAGFEDEILDALLQPATASKAYAALLRGGPGAIPMVLSWLNTRLPNRVKGMLYQFFGDMGGEETLKILRERLFASQGTANLECVRALARWRAREGRDPLEQEELVPILKDSLTRHFQLSQRIKRLEVLIPPDMLFPLKGYWRKKLEREEDTVLEIIGLIIEERLARRVRISLSGGSPQERRGAVEALEEVLPRAVRYPVVWMFDAREKTGGAPEAGRDYSDDYRTELEKLLEGGDRLEQTFALYILADFAAESISTESWRKIRALAGDPDPRIREAAEIALTGRKKSGVKKMLTVLEKIVFLQGVELFHHLSVEDLEYLADIAQEVNVGRGEVLFRENEPGDSLFLIVTGSVSVMKEEEGRRRLVAELGEQECVGEMAILSEEPRSATVETRETTTFLVIRGDEFRDLIRINPQMVYPIFRLLVDRIKAATAKAA